MDKTLFGFATKNTAHFIFSLKLGYLPLFSLGKIGV